MFYTVQASVTIESEEWSSTGRTLPTFYLNADVQGITGHDGAARVALDLVTGCMGEYLDTNDEDTVSVALTIEAEGVAKGYYLDARTGERVTR